MRVIELILSLITLILTIWHFILPHVKKDIYKWLTITNIPLLLTHLIFEGYRWQMLIVYFLSVFLLLSLVPGRSRHKTGRSRHKNRMQRILGIVLKIIAIISLSASIALSAILPVFRLPIPKGPFSVSTATYCFTDPSMQDPYSPEVSTHRKLAVTIWYPSENTSAEAGPYITDFKEFRQVLSDKVGIPNFLTGYLGYIKTNSAENIPAANQSESFPLLLFSHGMGTSRHLYTSILEELASHGYIIAAIDHTYSTMATVFPDGTSAVFATNIDDYNDEQLDALEAVWVQDALFVLDQLESLDGTSDILGLNDKIDMENVGVFGHSFGGAASYRAFCGNKRIKACVNIDGSIYSNISPVDRRDSPFMLITSEEYGRAIVEGSKTPIPDYSDLDEKKLNELKSQGISESQYKKKQEQLTSVYCTISKITENRTFISIKGTKHYNFSDIPFISPLTGPMGITGEIDGHKGIEIVNDYLLDFFDTHLKGKSTTSVEDNYPEVMVIDPSELG